MDLRYNNFDRFTILQVVCYEVSKHKIFRLNFSMENSSFVLNKIFSLNYLIRGN